VEVVAALQENHETLGLTDQQVLDMYRGILLARRLDERIWALNRQGRAAFVVSASGHEGSQIPPVMALNPEIDWALPYYRDLGTVLALGMTPEQVLLGVMAKAGDPSSNGRQMPSHWSLRERHIFTHSSPIATQYPHAAGIAKVLKGTGAVVLVTGGEGSTSEGDWHEMMNFAGIHQLPLIVLIENNQYAISVPERDEIGGHIAARAVGYGMHGVVVDGNDPLAVYKVAKDAADRARRGDGPTLIEAKTYRYYAHTSDDDDTLYRTREEVQMWRLRDPVAQLRQYLIEARLLSEAADNAMEDGIADEIKRALEAADGASDPDDPFTGVYRNPITPGPASTAPEPPVQGEETNLITAINRTLHEVMQRHPDTVVFGEDIADPKGGVFKATQGLEDAFGAERSFNTPLAESLIVGIGVGMAAAGKKPILEIEFADFIHPAFDQIVSEVAKIHYRSNGAWGCPLVIRAPYGGGIHGALYHSQSIESYYAHVPGLKVVIPSTPADVKGLLWSAVDDPDPVMFLEPKKLYRLATGPFPEGEHRIPLGKAAIRRSGTDLTIIAYGTMAYFSVEAAALLAQQGVSAEVIDVRTLKPLDWPTIESSVAKTARVLIVHEDNEFVGYGAELAAQIADKAFESLDAPVRRYASPDVPTFPYNGKLEAMIMPNTDGIVEHALELLKY
jgi:2-oxoisovalerate dehydrogenase E1 component